MVDTPADVFLVVHAGHQIISTERVDDGAVVLICLDCHEEQIPDV